jgi:sigma-E factor negative regulatory protein RseA
MIRKEELLSAFVDEEISELEVRRLCKELLGDERELARWGRYHLIRETLRGNLPAAIDVSFAANVMAKIGEGPLHVDSGRRDWRNGLLKPAAGFGLVASIAVVGVLGFQFLTGPPSTMDKVAQVASTPSLPEKAVPQVSVAASSVDKSPEDSLALNPKAAARLNSYLVNHSEYAPSRGMMPYARVVVGYEHNQP